MKYEKDRRIFIIMLSTLIVLVTAFYVEEIIAINSVSSVIEKEISLTGSRLSDSVYAGITSSESWDSNMEISSEYNFRINNSSVSPISNWKVIFDVPSGASLNNFWGCEAEIDPKSNKLYVSPAYYNITLVSGGYVEFGFIISSTDEVEFSTLKLEGYKQSSHLAQVVKRIIEVLFAVWAIVLIGFFVSGVNFRSYRERQKNDVKIILQSMNTFINFIDAKDTYTRGHSKRVAMYAAEIAKRMRLPENEVQNIYYAGLLHDAGKIAVPDAILNKPGKLSEEERQTIQNHTVAGGKMLTQLSSLKGVRETALYHHERYDGTGYPDGLKGETIPLYARIVGVADSYDAMSSNRVYRRHLNKDEIIEEIQKGSGSQFDPKIVKYMVDMINDGYVNVVKMETAENEDTRGRFHLTEDDIPGVYMGF